MSTRLSTLGTTLQVVTSRTGKTDDDDVTDGLCGRAGSHDNSAASKTFSPGYEHLIADRSYQPGLICMAYNPPTGDMNHTSEYPVTVKLKTLYGGLITNSLYSGYVRTVTGSAEPETPSP